MSLFIEYESRNQLEFPYEEIAALVTEAACDYVECPYETEINITITDNEEIAQINLDYRKIDAPTDVLSFPALDYEQPGDFAFLEEEELDYFNPETGELLLGDIIISVDKVKEQAIAYGHSEEREFAFLIAHSMFHLFGYDHMEAEEAAIMEAKQEELLQKLGIKR